MDKRTDGEQFPNEVIDQLVTSPSSEQVRWALAGCQRVDQAVGGARDAGRVEGIVADGSPPIRRRRPRPPRANMANNMPAACPAWCAVSRVWVFGLIGNLFSGSAFELTRHPNEPGIARNVRVRMCDRKAMLPKEAIDGRTHSMGALGKFPIVVIMAADNAARTNKRVPVGNIRSHCLVAVLSVYVHEIKAVRRDVVGGLVTRHSSDLASITKLG